MLEREYLGEPGSLDVWFASSPVSCHRCCRCSGKGPRETGTRVGEPRVENRMFPRFRNGSTSGTETTPNVSKTGLGRRRRRNRVQFDVAALRGDSRGRGKVRKAFRFVRATSQDGVSFDSGVTSSFASVSPVGSVPLGCGHCFQPYLGHQEMPPDISRLNSCPGIVVAADEDAVGAGPPSATRAHQPPG